MSPLSRHNIIGIDEVGRGPLAGPVVVCALMLSPDFRIEVKNSPCSLRDSKKLSERQRVAWYEWIVDNPQIRFAVARVYPRQIERLNISNAANLAATRACARIIRDDKSLGEVSGGATIRVFLDGGLYLNSIKSLSRNLISRTVVRGDESIVAITLASIVAKVIRDRFMNKLHKKYPEYGFDKHKGYGTSSHLGALRRFGATPEHRRTFLVNFIDLNKNPS